MTVIFQTGTLTGKEFEVKYIHEPILKENGEIEKAGRRFEIVPQEIDGITMPEPDVWLLRQAIPTQYSVSSYRTHISVMMKSRQVLAGKCLRKLLNTSLSMKINHSYLPEHWTVSGQRSVG